MTHDEYIQTLPDTQKQFVAELITELSEIKGISVYHTAANDGDLRVRMDIDGRVLFTMYWQPRNKAYFCRSLVETQYLDSQTSLFGVSLEPDYEPLVSSFRFKPNYKNTLILLTNVVSEAMKRNQFYLQNLHR